MFHADFPLQFQAGLHARPLGHLAHLGQLYGLTIDGKKLHPSNPEMAEYEAPHSAPDRVVRVAANSGDPDMDKRIVQYAKATIQAGDGPFRQMMHPFLQQGRDVIPVEQHKPAIMGAVGSLEQNPDWQPYVQVEPAAADRVAKVEKTAMGDLVGSILAIATGAGIPLGTAMAIHIDNIYHQQGYGSSAFLPQFVYKWLQENGYKKQQQAEGQHEQEMALMRGQNQTPEQVPPPGEHQAGWHEVAMPLQDFQTQRGDFGAQQGPTGEALCPTCGTINQPGTTQCMKCGQKIGLTQPSHSGGPSDAHSNPFTGNPMVASTVMSEMTKWHLADIGVGGPVQQQPDTPDGPFNDHRDVSEMSHEQAVGHERLVNIVVDEMNKALTQGSAIDATLVNNLVQWLVDKFGQDADSAQAIVDTAAKQAQTSDGRLDNTPVVPDPSEQAAQQAVQPNQGDVVTDPNQAQNNGAFVSHVRTPSGRVGHVTDTWEDMYGEKWAAVECSDGYRESAYEDDLTEVDAPESENGIKELHDFIESLEPVEASVPSIKARIANLRIVKQEIRRHMTNPRLSYEDKLALDQMDADASVDMLALTDAVVAHDAKEAAYLDTQPKFATSMADDVQPTLYGVEHLALDEAPEPEWTNEALDAFLPEEAEVMVSELAPHVRADQSQLETVAASFVDGLTAGHSAEDRARHRSRFVTLAKSVASEYATVDEPDTTEDTGDWDGPAEGIFA